MDGPFKVSVQLNIGEKEWSTMTKIYLTETGWHHQSASSGTRICANLYFEGGRISSA